MFHELCHALHELEGTTACKQHKIIPTFYKFSDKDLARQLTCKAWTDDEEIRTITGWYVDENGERKFDWLNTNSYIVLEDLKRGTPPKEILQRVFHCDYPKYRIEYQGAVIEQFDEIVIPLENYT